MVNWTCLVCVYHLQHYTHAVSALRHGMPLHTGKKDRRFGCLWRLGRRLRHRTVRCHAGSLHALLPDLPPPLTCYRSLTPHAFPSPCFLCLARSFPPSPSISHRLARAPPSLLSLLSLPHPSPTPHFAPILPAQPYLPTYFFNNCMAGWFLCFSTCLLLHVGQCEAGQGHALFFHLGCALKPSLTHNIIGDVLFAFA